MSEYNHVCCIVLSTLYIWLRLNTTKFIGLCCFEYMLEERSEFANKIKHIDSDVTTGQVTHVKLCHPSICTQTY